MYLFGFRALADDEIQTVGAEISVPGLGFCSRIVPGAELSKIYRGGSRILTSVLVLVESPCR